MLRSIAALLALLPSLALAGERTLVLKTFEEKGYTTDAGLCMGPGFEKLLGASVWTAYAWSLSPAPVRRAPSAQAELFRRVAEVTAACNRCGAQVQACLADQ